VALNTRQTSSERWPAIGERYPTEQGNCANSAYRDAETENANLLETLADACRGLDITPVEVKEALAPEDIEDWRKDAVSNDTLPHSPTHWCSGGKGIKASAPPTTPSRPPASTAARSSCGSLARF